MIPPVIEQLGRFLKNGEVGPEIRQAADVLGPLRLRVATIHLFNWLKFQARMASKRPLTLGEGLEWSQNVCDVLNAVKDFGMIFVVTEKELDFRDEMQEVAREEIRRFVQEFYQPRLFTDPMRNQRV